METSPHYSLWFIPAMSWRSLLECCCSGLCCLMGWRVGRHRRGLAGKGRGREEWWEGVGQDESERKKFEYFSCKQQCWRALLSRHGFVLYKMLLTCLCLLENTVRSCLTYNMCCCCNATSPARQICLENLGVLMQVRGNVTVQVFLFCLALKNCLHIVSSVFALRLENNLQGIN